MVNFPCAQQVNYSSDNFGRCQLGLFLYKVKENMGWNERDVVVFDSDPIILQVNRRPSKLFMFTLDVVV